MKRILFLFVLLFPLLTFSQLSTVHYIPPISSTPGDLVSGQFIYISTPSANNVSFTVTPMGKPDDVYTGIVSNANPFLYRIVSDGGNPESDLDIDLDGDTQLSMPYVFGGIPVSDRGYKIEATSPIYVSIRFRSQNTFQAGAIVSKGISALGNEFRIGGMVNQNFVNGYMSFATIMATEDNTTVSLSEMDQFAELVNIDSSSPQQVVLNEGQSYLITTNPESGRNPNRILGTRISSDKPIVVNSGSATGTFGEGNGRDYGIDQIVGFDKVGSEYIFVRGDGFDDWENVLLVAHENNTTVRINGGPVIATLNAGTFYVIEGDNFNNNGNMYVETSNPVFAYQGVGGNGGNEFNQGLFFVPPLSCENRGNLDNIAQIDDIGSDDFAGGISLVVEEGSDVTINDQAINNFATLGPFTVTGKTGYVTYKVLNLTGDITIKSDGELYCAYFNANGAATSGSFYSGFPAPPEITFTNTVTTLGSCIPNVILEAANSDSFDSLEWFYDDGNGFVSTGNMTGSITPTQPGDYQLVGTINCSGATFLSPIIPVSECPDDYDGDLVIDNLDIDLDNDGILNCDESLGDATFDFTDTDNPLLSLADNTDISSIVSSNFNSTGAVSFTGDNSGNFTSQISSSPTTSNLEYELDFTESISVEFAIDPLLNTALDGTVFVVSIGPNNKNLTILDPDNVILIDSNFDGVYEPDSDNFSASQIRFILNSNATGTTPVRFRANSVNEFNFEHELTNASTDSELIANLKITCYSKDSDNDGIIDALDLDSDNDGNLDITEGAGQFVTLTNDTNLDGLNDVFSSLTIVDSDNDGILDYLDLDSDNDGIYDLFEKGHNQPDADFDGRIDNAINLVGENGLVNALETAADSGVLNYTVLDSDSNSFFDYIDLDADGDACNDVLEALFDDPDADGIIGTSPVDVDDLGKVINILDGYTNPGTSFQTSEPIVINTAFEDVSFCEGSTSIITIDTTADIIQWELSTDNGNSWNTLSNDATYNGVNTPDLQISNITLTMNQHQFRVQLERTGLVCSDESNEVTMTVEPLPTLNTNIELRQCDDDTDGVSTFNLTEANSLISANYQNETFEYYTSFSDADTGTNPIADPTNYRNTTSPTNDTVWARVSSTFGCVEIAEVSLFVNTVSNIPQGPIEFVTPVCDDDTGIVGSNSDGISLFDFSYVDPQIRALFPANEPIVISYYENLEDAEREINSIQDISNYRNTDSPIQIIYVRADNTQDNSCQGISPYIQLEVLPVPVSNPVQEPIILCDDGDDGIFDNGIVQSFDLTSKEAEILGSQSNLDYTVTYHLTPQDAESGNNAVATPATFENTVPGGQTIYVRVTSNDPAGCFDDSVTFDVIVNPLPVANFVEDLPVCDDNSDGSAQNGFAQNIDLTVQTAGILGNQDPNIYTVSYHTSLTSAQGDNTGLITDPTNFSSDPNGPPFEQLVYVRVTNTNTQCLNGISNFKVVVNPEPIFIQIENDIYCDNATDGDDTSGIITDIDFNKLIPDILGPTQSIGDFNVTFHETPADATSGDNALPTPYTNTTRDRQTIYVRIENDRTGCVNDNLTFDVIINPLPSFTVITPQTVCLSGPTLFISADNPATIYDYEWTLPNGDTVLGVQEIEITSGGIYRIQATTTDGTGCSRIREIEVDESIIATITQDDVTIVDDSDNNSITIDPTNLGIGDYEYALINEKGEQTAFQDEPFFENLQGGFYTIVVQDKKGCRPNATLEVSVIEFPKFFTPNNDGENDTWAIKGVNSTFYPNSSINIFNRFGKLVATIDIDNPGWDGSYNGRTLPSDDYWFSVSLTPSDNSKPAINRKGNFSLLRR